MTTCIAANGQEITEAMIDRWCEAYDRGEFPAGERTVGEVVVGRPPLFGDKTATLAVRLPTGMKAAVVQKAQSQGVTTSTYVRSIIASALMSA